MIKTFTSLAVEFFGTQALVFSCGLLIVLLCHALFDLSAHDAAQNVFSAQMITSGWIFRGWFVRFTKEEE